MMLGIIFIIFILILAIDIVDEYVYPIYKRNNMDVGPMIEEFSKRKGKFK